MTIVSIAGMHRSGTSMVARLLNLCGLYLGEESELVPPGPDNPEGFWENSRFVSLNDEILSELGAGWDFPPQVERGWELRPEMELLRAKAGELIRSFSSHALWGWKDPRNALTLPFWRHLYPSMKVVICLRNPLEVAQSLFKRNYFSVASAFNLWLIYNQRLLQSPARQNFIVTHYDSYFYRPKDELKRVLSALGTYLSDDVINSAVGAVSIPLRNNRATLLDFASKRPPASVVELYKEMCVQAGPIYQDLSEDDPIRRITTFLGQDDHISEGEEKQHPVELVQKENIIKLLIAEVADKDQTVQVLTARVAEEEKMVQSFSIQLADIISSESWKTAVLIGRIRLVLAPNGSRRERLMYLAIRAYQVLRRDGWRQFLRTVARRLFLRGVIKSETTKALESSRPAVSIIIPVFNAWQLTRNCIQRIYEVGSELSFEVIVVDNHSTDGTRRVLAAQQKMYANFRSYCMPDNLGFAGAVNYGCRQSKGDYVVVLNNDTLVTTGWLDRLIEPFSGDELIGIVSPVTNYVGEGPQIDQDATEIDPKDIESYAEKIKRREYVYEPNRLVFFCVAISRKVLNLVGDLDLGYEKGNYEDDDYCMRTLVAGLRLAIARGAFVYHFGTMTFKKNRISHTEFMEKNRKRFYQKAQNISVTLRQPKQRSPDSLISVIVRTLDRPELLREALTSLSNQTLSNFEAVVVNDGGQDVSGVLGPFEQYFPIRYIHNAVSKGRSAALNIGIEHSKADWIVFLDDDDIVYPWHLDALLSATKTNPESEFFYSNYNRCLIRSKSERYPLLTEGTEPWKYDPRQLLVRNHIPINTWLISRRCFNIVGNFIESMLMLEDFEFLVRLSKAFNFHHVPRFTCEYRFYFDGANSMLVQRPKTLEALGYIYDHHPVDDPRIAGERKSELAQLNAQIGKIQRLQAELEAHPEQVTRIYREIFDLVAGI